MGRNIFLSTLTLIAGICIGVLVMIVFVEPAPPVSPPDTVLSSPIASPAPGTNNTDASPSEQIVMTATPVPEHPPYDNRALLSLAFDIASVLEQRDYQTLSTYVHPSEGVLFTPYSTVDLNANLSFTPYQVAKLGSDTTKYVWGISDGKGEPLELTVSDYFSRYVYNADYTQAPLLGVDRIIGSGNALENVLDVFPDCRFVEFYFPGIAPEYNGFDWCGLKLVFLEYQGEYKLRAIIHSEWTI